MWQMNAITDQNICGLAQASTSGSVDDNIVLVGCVEKGIDDGFKLTLHAACSNVS